ncbi:TonB-dependent receptor [Maribellus sediminis]|uniref:TonB-dependent receptor n=1 Tax=Maribellus sediminis TaxID=2696285 RepID=UPI0014311A9B|nr:TonB-dependent receptor [Maribellus sediminis]
MKTILLTILICTLPAFMFAQGLTQTVKGKITDADTKGPLPGANIVLLTGGNTMKGAASDGNGNFKIEKVPVGRQSFKVSFLGYEDVTLNEIMVGSGREVVLNIEMKESVADLDEVTVYAYDDKSEPINQMATISATQITVESTSRIAAGINDPGRTAQSFAGVSSADDENNELVIRGNSPRGMLWRMEGIEIPNPNHFTNGEGGSGGGVSALSTQVLANSDFFTGAFPAEYGNALSGVFDLKLRNGNYEKHEYAFQLGVLGAQAALEGPLKKGSEASYLFNYRYSTLKLLSKVGIDISGGDIIPEWQDLSYKFYIPTKKAGYFSVWGLGGISSAGSTVVQDTSQWMYRSDRFRDTENHQLGIAGITHNYLFPNSKTYIKTVAAYSHTKDDITVDSLNYDLKPATTEDENFTYNTLSFNSFINHKFNAQHVLMGGFIFHNRGYNLDASSLNFDTGNLEQQVKSKGSTQVFESYVQWKYRLNEKVDINSGLHYTFLALNKDYSIEPRLGIRWDINKQQRVNFGAGLHSKIEPISIYLAERELSDGSTIQPNKDLKITKAAHVVMGYNWNFARDFRIKAEVYYQHLYDVPVDPKDSTNTVSSLNFSSGFTNEKLTNQGTGRNYGLELTLEKFFSNNWYMLTTASLFESKYTMPDGVERNTAFNSKYIFNVVGGKEFEVGKNKQNILGLNLRTMWRGGYRTTPLDLDASLAQNREVRDYSRAFETKAPDYFRVDCGISYRKNKPSWSWIVSLDVQNVSGRLNVWDEYYSPETGKVEKSYMNGLIPILNYRIEF